MSGKRRLITGFVILATILAWGGGYALLHVKVSSLVQRRLERLTGHRTTIGGFTLSRSFELVAHDVRIAGAPPFESRTLAHAERVTVRLRGPDGFWSASEVTVDGLDVEYLGTTAGDNVFGQNQAGKPGAMRGRMQSWTSAPRILVRSARLHGSVALPYGSHLEFRVPKASFERATDGAVRTWFGDLVVEVQGWASMRAQTLQAEYSRERLLVTSGGRTTLESPGGGTWLDGLALTVEASPAGANFELRSDATPVRQFALTGTWQPQTAEISLDIQDLPLRALGTLAALGTSANRQAVGLENAKASLHARFTVDRPNLLADYEVEARVAGVDILHPAIDTVPWRNQAGSLRLRGRADFSTGRFDIEEGTLGALAARLSVTGWMETGRTSRGSFTISTPRSQPLSCAALLLGQPKPVRQALTGLELEGNLGFSASVEFDTSDWEELKFDANFDPVCKVSREPQVLADLLPVLRRADAAAAASTELPLGLFHPDFVTLHDMSPHVPYAFVTAEDSRFYTHHGFDLEMIRYALAQDFENRSFDRGASTITQQLAKNLFLSHRRTLARKLEEAILAWRLQSLLSRDRILEIYLNVIELGPGIRGVKQAARAYFTRGIASLTPLESVYLAALTPNPHVLSRRFRDGQVDEGWQQRLYDLLGSMRRHGRLSPAQLAEARAAKLVLRDRSQDTAAPGAH